eukprot:3655089-Alexandrium_andersonii.AAC.1
MAGTCDSTVERAKAVDIDAVLEGVGPAHSIAEDGHAHVTIVYVSRVAGADGRSRLELRAPGLGSVRVERAL